MADLTTNLNHRLIDDLRTMARDSKSPSEMYRSLHEALGGDERAVFGQLTKGKSDAEIATHLGMTRSDIQRIHKSLSRKLGIAAQRLF